VARAPIPRHRQIGEAQQLFLAVAQSITDRLLHLRLGYAAQPGDSRVMSFRIRMRAPSFV